MPAFLTSPLLSAVPGVFHGFTLREGGVSPAPYNSLNLGQTFGAGDDPANVAQNVEKVRQVLGASRVVKVRQVHGDRVVDVADAGPAVEADGMVSSVPGAALCVLVADCVPVVLSRRDGTAVAAVHAGWRGAVARIASQAVRRLGTADVVAALGPSIGPCCFEVGAEVVTAAVAVGGADVVSTGPRGRPHVDLWAVVKADLVSAGMRPEHVDVLGVCTVCDTRCFSHRREHGNTGRMGGLVGRR